MVTYEVLEKALALIEDEGNWCGHGWGADGSRCALHAISDVEGVANSFRKETQACHDFQAFTFSKSGKQIGQFNDTHTHAQVCDLFREAIRNEKAKAGITLEVPEPELVAA